MVRSLIIIVFILYSVCSDALTIYVTSQADFDRLSEEICTAVDEGEKVIDVEIRTKKLTFADNQIFLKGIKHNDVSISVHGNGVHIMSRGRYVNSLKSPDYMYIYKGGYYNPWTEFIEATDTVEIVDEDTHLCRIYTPYKNKVNSNPEGLFIQHTCWYISQTSSVTALEKWAVEFDGGVWAVPIGKSTFNINMEYQYAKRYPRYRLFGTKEIPERLYECSASTLLQIQSCNLKCLIIDGIIVLGSSNFNPLISFNTNKVDSIVIKDSYFSCIGGTLLLDRNTDNISFTRNIIENIRGKGVLCEYGCKGMRVTGNKFKYSGLDMRNTFAIEMNGDGFIVNNNILSNFHYGGIGVGIWGGASTKAMCTGIVSDNELYYTDEFLANLQQNTLMDSGAIYVWPRTDGITISNNYIHDISGMKDNRGIFCDDGTQNVTICDNRIENIANSYDIDLRWCDTYKDKIPDHNTGNEIRNNRTTGFVRFENR